MTVGRAEQRGANLQTWPFAVQAGAWVLFWLLAILVALQDYLRSGRQRLWEPVLWEGSSFMVATAIVLLNRASIEADDALLDAPWRWFARRLILLVPISAGFVVAVFAIRHGVYWIAGSSYTHEPWLDVFVYESTKFAMFYLLFSAVIFGVRSHAAMNAARLKAVQAQNLARQAQLTQLAQEIEPHFLFNALSTIAETIHTDPELADSLLTKLGSLLRAATDLSRRVDVPLGEEVALLEAYSSIMTERFSDRVRGVRFDVSDAVRTCVVPSLLLQPLLENTFRHGVEKNRGAASIEVMAHEVEPGRLRISVGADSGHLDGAPAPGTGLSNLHDRLANRFGTQATLVVEPRPGGGVHSVVTLPCVR